MARRLTNAVAVITSCLIYLLLVVAVWKLTQSSLESANITKFDTAKDPAGNLLSLPVMLQTNSAFEPINLDLVLQPRPNVAIEPLKTSAMSVFIPVLSHMGSISLQPDEKGTLALEEPKHGSANLSGFSGSGNAPLVTGHLIAPLALGDRQFLNIRLISNSFGNAFMSPVYLGAFGDLNEAISIQRFLNLTMRRINLGASTMIALLSLTFWGLNRREVAFLWLGLGLCAQIIMNTGALMGVLSAGSLLSARAFSIIPIAMLATVFFAAYLLKQRVPRAIILIGIGIPALSLALGELAGIDRPTIWLSLTFPTAQLCLASAAWMLLRSNIRQVEWDQLLIAVSFIGLLLAINIDILSRLGHIESLATLSPLATLMCLLSIGLHIVRRQHQLLNETRDLSVQKDTALKQQAEELSRELARNVELVARNASLEEHQRLTSMLHSGVATNLSSIAVLQSDNQLDSSIGLSARHGLFEVRLMTNHANSPVDLCAALPQYFAEVISSAECPANKTGFRTHYHQTATADLGATLEIVRVIHQLALMLWVTDEITISRADITCDNGQMVVAMLIPGLSDTDTNVSRSLVNLSLHARSFGGHVTLVATGEGLEVVLTCPTSF